MAEHEPPADHPIPDGTGDEPDVRDSLVDALVCATGVMPHDIRHVLSGLHRWADGALIDPATWTRWDREELQGVEMCVAHDEPHIEAHDVPKACRDAEDHECEICEGNGYQVDPVGDSYDCVDCNATGMEPGYVPCDLVPLFTLTKRED